MKMIVRATFSLMRTIRDNQAWSLAVSEHPILDAFSEKYSSDQYGGLLAFNALHLSLLITGCKRPLMLVLFSAFFAALGVPFLWKAVSQVFGEKVAWASAWIFALYPESILLGASAMREPYLLTFSAFALWGFIVQLHIALKRSEPIRSNKVETAGFGLDLACLACCLFRLRLLSLRLLFLQAGFTSQMKREKFPGWVFWPSRLSSFLVFLFFPLR